jgi:uroporphyrinogen-III synthase
MPSAGPPRTGRPLDGRTIVVTRSRTQASSLVDRLTALGAVAVELPVIAIAEAADAGAALRAAADRLAGGGYDWVAVTSANAVTRLVDALDGRPLPAGVQLAAVGPATGRALKEAGLGVDLVPATATGDDLAAAFPSAPDGGRVLVPRAEVVRGALADGLRAKGWTVDDVVAYRTVGGRPDPAAVAAARRADAVAFTSSSTVDRTVGLLGASGVPGVVVTIGPVTSASARAAGLPVTVEAPESTIDGLVAALVSALAADPWRQQQQ